jgi:serine/threonine protein kinase
VEKLLKLSLNARNSLLAASPWYTAPEVIEGSNYTAAMDSWSLGCIVYHLLTGKRPFDDYDAVGATFQVVEEEIVIPSEDFSELGQEFIRTCLNKSVEERPTAEKLLQHPWIKYHVLPGGEANLITLIQQEKAPVRNPFPSPLSFSFFSLFSLSCCHRTPILW